MGETTALLQQEMLICKGPGAGIFDVRPSTHLFIKHQVARRKQRGGGGELGHTWARFTHYIMGKQTSSFPLKSIENISKLFHGFSKTLNDIVRSFPNVSQLLPNY